MPVPPTLTLGIKKLEQVIQMTPASSATAILTTARTILQVVEAGKSEDPDRQRVADLVLDIAVAYTEAMDKLDETDSNQITALNSNLLRCLETIARALTAHPKRKNFLTRALTRTANRKLMKTYEAELMHSASMLETHITLRSLKLLQAIEFDFKREDTERVMEEELSEAHQETLELIKSQVLEQSRKNLQRSSFGHLPPLPSPIFLGREYHMDHLVGSLVQSPSYHAVLGPGGIGKTSLALNVIHDPRIIATYGKYRFFLACETTMDANGIVAGLADIFNLDEKSFIRSFKRLCAIINSNILFLLDNFETPWERPETRKKVEELLGQLADIPNLSIVITLRGAERPFGVLWSRPFIPALEPLDITASCQIFLSIADVREDDPYMHTLLEEVEGIPLAITLLGTLAQSVSCESLLIQWIVCKTSMVTRGWDSRLSSLDVSISLSLASVRFTSSSEALGLLQILSLLPDGATMLELEAMIDSAVGLHKAVSTLCQVALAYNTPHDRIRVLAPIREYIQAKHAITHELLQPVFSYHSTLARNAFLSEWTSEMINVTERLRTCIANIHNVIHVTFGIEDLEDLAIRAAIHIASFHRTTYSGSISTLLQQAVSRAGLTKKPILQAECLMYLAIDAMTRFSDYPAAEGYLIESINLLRSCSPSSEVLVCSLTQLSRFLTKGSRDEEAVPLANEAVRLISESTSMVIRTLAHIQLGSSLTFTGSFAQGTKSFNSAALSFSPALYPRLSMRYHDACCEMYIRRDMFSQAIAAANISLSIDTGSEPRHADGLLLHRRGLAYLCQGRYQAAREDLRQAKDILASSADEWLMSNGFRFLGVTYLACRDYHAAASNFRIASQLSSTIASLGLIDDLATLYLHQNYFDEALECCEKSAAETRDVTTVVWATLGTLQARAQVQIRRGDAADAIAASVSATIIGHKIACRASIATGMMCLGDASYFIDNDVSSAKACYQAFLDLVRYTGMRRWIANALMRIGVMDYLEGDPRLASRRLHQAARIYKETEGEAERRCQARTNARVVCDCVRAVEQLYNQYGGLLITSVVYPQLRFSP